MADQIPVPPLLNRVVEAANVVQAPSVPLNVPAPANVPAPTLAVPAPAPPVAAQGANNLHANNLAGHEPGEVNI